MSFSGMGSLMPFGYLDPGSGSALVGTLIALAGALLYSAKSFFYRLVKGKAFAVDTVDNNTIVVFSEGKNYWGTFRPIVNELINRRIHFRYYSMDLFDPGLEIDSEFMQSRLFDKNSAASFVKLSNIKTPVMLATTPNIGSPEYPLKRSPGVQQLIHVFHAFADVSAYHKGSLDHYDTVVMVGDHQIEPIRAVEKARGIAQKELVSLGLPYIDDLYEHMPKGTHQDKESKTILVASSWGEKGCLREYGTDFINALAGAGYAIIVRPHPQSYVSESEFIEKCMQATSESENVRWDSASIGNNAMFESDLLISDTSSIRFDYAFLYGKPVITLEIPRERQDAYESVYMDKVWTDEAGEKIGSVVNKERIKELPTIVAKVLEAASSNSLESYRDEVITNFGKSAVAIVDLLIKKAAAALESAGGNNA